MISKGSYSHASDVYAFGVVVWEMFAALTFGRERQHEQTSPYCELSSKDEVSRSTTQILLGRAERYSI